MRNLQDFVLYDDRSRWRAIGWIIGIAATLGSVQLAFLNVSLNDAVFSMGVVILLLSVGWIGWYCSFRPYQNTEPLLSRRNLLIQALPGLAGLFVGLGLLRYQTFASERAIRRALIDPGNLQNMDDAQRVIESAKITKIKIAPSIMEGAGRKFIQASDENPEAWNAALAVVSYKTSINALPSQFSASSTGKVDGRLNLYARKHPAGTDAPQLFSSTFDVPKEQAAYYNPIGRDQNSGQEFGNAFLFAQGGVEILDGMKFKHVAFKDVEIYYSGGPVVLSDVVFINCTFKMNPDFNSKNLAVAILAPAISTTFSGE